MRLPESNWIRLVSLRLSRVKKMRATSNMKVVQKGQYMTITVDDSLLQYGVAEFQDSLIGRLIYKRGDSHISHDELACKLQMLHYADDRERIFCHRSWALNPRVMKLQRWVPDFNPYKVQTSVVQVWIRLYELPMEYWQKEILSAMASVIGKVIKIDDRTLS
ncbi:hypothetical protein ACS0TY_013921 [Phlomoides rotata]